MQTTSQTQRGGKPVQATKKSGIGARDGQISELATFWEVKPGHEDQLRAAVKRFADTLVNAPIELNVRTGLRDQRHVIFDGGKRLLWVTTFETDWDPYIEDAILAIGVEKFLDWMQHTEQWDTVEAWVRSAGGVEGMNKSQSDATAAKTARANTRGLKEIVQSVQVPADGYFNAVSYATHPELRRAMKVNEAFQRVLDNPGAADALKNPALKPLMDLAAD